MVLFLYNDSYTQFYTNQIKINRMLEHKLVKFCREKVDYTYGHNL